MGIRQTLRNIDARLSREAAERMKSGTVGFPAPGWAPPPGWAGQSASGVNVTEDTANSVAAWFQGVRVISRDVAKLPLILYRVDGRNRERAYDHPLYRLLHDAPNPDMTSLVFRMTLQAHLLGWGNAYAEKELNGAGRVVGLWPLRPDRMEVRWENGRRAYRYRPTQFAQPIDLSADRIFHIPGLGFDGLQGYSVLKLARETIGNTVALREYGARVLRNDARPSVALQVPALMSDTAYQRLVDSWEDKHGGFTNAGRTAILEEGITLKDFGFPPEDIQFLESQKWQVSEVARWLDVKPHKIGDLERATFSNIEEENLDHYGGPIQFWCTAWEQQLAKDVVMDRTLLAEHNMDAALRGKTLERAQAWVLKINAGAAVPNEWRASDNQNPLAWGDERVSTPNNTAPMPSPAGTTPATTGGPA